ncbi:SMI1/KNR4 family protein [Celerinatantimonas sp. MCCC 1A17872]|uniref:SMI1/KNR4 family protein n=1 Tax=Celerinatantimonas sp. MCCC 1A17872 TaxID=3177514 RepID=UPI0038C7F7E6
MWITDVFHEYAPKGDYLLASFLKSDEQKINLLESMANVTFPQYYREFLLFCGGNKCPIFEHLPATFDVDGLISTYEEYDEFPEDFPCNDWFIIGAGYFGIDILMNLKTQKMIEGDSEETGVFLSSSFIDFFKQRLFLKLCILDEIESFSFSVSKAISNELSYEIDSDILKLCEKYSKIDRLLSDKRQKIFKGNDINIYVSFDDYSNIIYLSGKDSEKFISDLKEKVTLVNVK